MSEQSICPVSQAIADLSQGLTSRRLSDPRARRRVGELLELLEDVSRGRGGPEHLPVIEDLADRLIKGGDGDGIDLGMVAAEAIAGHREIFQSHVDTHNCPTGDCDLLAPAPCQMACPAGIDVASYVSLIGQGRDAEAVELIRRDKDIEFPWDIATMVLQHHERLDGSGYPEGVTGERILLEARILTVADVVEAMASHRPYGPSLGMGKAMEEIKGKKARFYDPDVVDACVGLFEENKFAFK